MSRVFADSEEWAAAKAEEWAADAEAWTLRRWLVVVAAVLGILGGVKAVDAYGDWRWAERCVKHHADFCNNDGDGDGGKPWWAHRGGD